MATAAQIHANQINAQRSTGPVSAEGKARSAQNARCHGFTAHTLTISDEDRAAFDALEASLRLQTRPTGCLEEELFHRILSHTWNLRRIEAFEAVILAGLNPLDAPGVEAANLERYARYRRDLERSLYRAMKEFGALQTERAALQMQPPSVLHAFVENAPAAKITGLLPEVRTRFGDLPDEQIPAQLRFSSGLESGVEYSRHLGAHWLERAAARMPAVGSAA